MTHCQRCGRVLKSPDSISRGYGRSCWQKVCKNMQAALKALDDPCTIADVDDALETLRAIQGEIDRSGERCTCGTLLSDGELLLHDHDGGVALKGYGKPQWVYVHCLHCGYDTALWKAKSITLDRLSPGAKEIANV